MCRWLSLMSFWHCWVPASGRSSNLWSAQARGAQVTRGGVPGDRHFISPPGIPVWHHSINNGAINYDLLDWWIRLDRKEECSCVIILHWFYINDFLESGVCWEGLKGRIYICQFGMTHSQRSNYIGDKWCHWYDDDSLPQHANTPLWKHADLYCETLMSRSMTADTVFNESSILITHLASQKPPVNSGYLWSSCMEAI